MNIQIIEQKLKSYSVSSEIEEIKSLREIPQEVILASLEEPTSSVKQHSKVEPVCVFSLTWTVLVRIWISLSWIKTLNSHDKSILSK